MPNPPILRAALPLTMDDLDAAVGGCGSTPQGGQPNGDQNAADMQALLAQILASMQDPLANQGGIATGNQDPSANHQSQMLEIQAMMDALAQQQAAFGALMPSLPPSTPKP